MKDCLSKRKIAVRENYFQNSFILFQTLVLSKEVVKSEETFHSTEPIDLRVCSLL